MKKRLKLKHIMGIIGLLLPLISYADTFAFIYLNPIAFYAGYLLAWATGSDWAYFISSSIIGGAIYYGLGILIMKAKKESAYIVILVLYALAHFFIAPAVISEMKSFTW